jgi:hypothetical protein
VTRKRFIHQLCNDGAVDLFPRSVIFHVNGSMSDEVDRQRHNEKHNLSVLRDE